MGDVVEINDPFSYIISDDGKGDVIEAVQWMNQQTSQMVVIENNGSIFCSHTLAVPRHELRQLMIMWLALNYPDVLKCDELEKETMIRAGTT